MTNRLVDGDGDTKLSKLGVHGAENIELGSQSAFCNPPEEVNMAATIRNLAPLLQFTLISPNFPKELNYPTCCSPALAIKSGRRRGGQL